MGAALVGVGVWAYLDSDSLVKALARLPEDDEPITEALDKPSFFEYAAYGKKSSFFCEKPGKPETPEEP